MSSLERWELFYHERVQLSGKFFSRKREEDDLATLHRGVKKFYQTVLVFLVSSRTLLSLLVFLVSSRTRRNTSSTSLFWPAKGLPRSYGVAVWSNTASSGDHACDEMMIRTRFTSELVKVPGFIKMAPIKNYTARSVCVCVYHNEKKVPAEWQAGQAIPVILQVSSSKHNAKKNTTRVRGSFHQSFTAIRTEEK